MASPSMDEIRKLVGLQLGLRRVDENDRFMEDLGAESADLANLIAAVEEKYQIEIKESEIAHILTPADLWDLVRQRV